MIVHLDGTSIIEARRISGIDIYSLARIQSRQKESELTISN